MELPGVEQIELDEATKALLKDVDETARRVDDFRPLSEAVSSRLQHELLGERVCASNAIEGNTLDLRETRAVLETGYIDIPKRREATEARNLGRAIEYSQEHLLHSGTPLIQDGFLKLHQMLLEDINDDWAGRFRDERVMILGAKHQPPTDQHVPEMVNRFFERLNERPDVHPVLLGTWAHWTIARIHPFFDGNGRMARLWQDILFFRSKLTCAIIRPVDRQEYLSALQEADEERFDPLVRFVAQRVLSTLDKYVEAQQGLDQLEEWASTLGGEVGARSAEHRELDYMRWSRKMEQIRFEFQRCAASLTKTATEIEVQVRSYEMIGQGQWENIRTGVPVKETWFFTLVIRHGSHSLRYIFFFGKHYWSDSLDTERDRSEPRVALLISEQVRNDERAKRLGEDGFDTPLSIRELFVVDDQLIRKRYDTTQDKDVYDRGVDTIKIVQEFIQEVLLVRMVEP